MNSKNCVAARKGRAAGAMPMRLAAWSLCRREWKALSLRSRPPRLHLGTNKFMVPEEVRVLASSAAQCCDPVKRKVLRKHAQKARREFDLEVGALPRGKIDKEACGDHALGQRRGDPEDREEWCDEVRLHFEKCYDDKSETSEKQTERIGVQECRDDSAVAFHCRRVLITVNRVLRARGKMLRGKSNGPADCLVVEMLSCQHTKVIFEVTHWFQKKFQRIAELQRLGAFCAWCSSRSMMQDWRRGFVVSVRLLY